MKVLIFLFVSILFLGCQSQSDTHFGKDFIGIWQTNDSLKVTINIRYKLDTQNKIIKDRFIIDIIDKENLPIAYNYLEGHYNYNIIARGSDLYTYPFRECIYKNTSLREQQNYIGLKNNVLIKKTRPYK